MRRIVPTTRLDTLAVAAVCSVLLVAAAAARPSAGAPLREPAVPDFPPTDFSIQTTAGETIGHSQYAIVRDSSGTTLRGENRFLDGQVDVEVAHFLAGGHSGAPALANYRHTYYKTDNSLLLDSDADFVSGFASCIDYRGERPAPVTATISFPPQTWAGSSVLVPIQQWVKSGSGGNLLELDVFNCTSTPELFHVRVTRDSTFSFDTPRFSPGVLKIEIRPVLGWWDVLIAPFIPRLYAWFDPSRRFDLAGVQLPRFYRGPVVVLEPIAPAAEPPRRR